MQNISRTVGVAVTIISLGTMGNVNAADDLNKDALINAAKQLGHASESDDLDAMIKVDKIIAPTQANTEPPKQTHDSLSRVKGVLPDELRKSNRLALYGKQKLVIHDESKHLKNSVVELTQALSVSESRLLNTPVASDDFDTQSMSIHDDEVINDTSLGEKNTQSLKHDHDKLKASVSALKRSFASKEQSERGSEKGDGSNK